MSKRTIDLCEENINLVGRMSKLQTAFLGDVSGGNNVNINHRPCEAQLQPRLGAQLLEGEYNGWFDMLESELVSNGDGGYRGIVRFGRVLYPSSRNIAGFVESEVGERIAIKELLGDKHAKLVYTPAPVPLLGEKDGYTDVTPNFLDVEFSPIRILSFMINDREHIVAVVVKTESAQSQFHPAPLSLMLEVFGTDQTNLDPSFVPLSYLDFLRRRKALMSEIEMMVKVPVHPNLVHLIDTASLIDGNILRLFVVMPFVPCGDLLDFLTQKKPSPDVAKNIFLQIVNGAQALHEAGVAHRDIKCDNVLVDAYGNPKIGDFGLAGCALTALHARIGSPHIVAPEILEHGTEPSTLASRGPQFRGYNGYAADVWSMGIVLFQTLVHADFWCFVGQSNRIARMGMASASDLGFQQILKKTARLPPKIPREAADLILQMLEPNPISRPTLEQIKSHPWLSSSPL